MDAESLTDRVISLVARKTGVKVSKISQQTDLVYDLGIDGDDAVELIDEFEHEFGVEMPNSEYDKHFGPEGLNPLCLFSLSWWRDKAKPLTIADLVRAAESGVWPPEKEG
jgi:acyl carrier protein